MTVITRVLEMLGEGIGSVIDHAVLEILTKLGPIIQSLDPWEEMLRW